MLSQGSSEERAPEPEQEVLKLFSNQRPSPYEPWLRQHCHLVAACPSCKSGGPLVQRLLGSSTGDTGDHHRQQEPSLVEVRAAQGLCDGVGTQYCGQPLSCGWGHLGRCLQEVQQRHVSGILALWPPHPRNGPSSFLIKDSSPGGSHMA